MKLSRGDLYQALMLWLQLNERYKLSMMALLNEQMGVPTVEPDPLVGRFIDFLIERLADAWADRLEATDGSSSLVSAEKLVAIYMEAISWLEAVLDEKLEDEDRQYFRELLNGLLNGMDEAVLPLVKTGADPRDRTLEWARTVRDVAHELGCHISDLLDNQEALDAITRRTESRDSYSAEAKRAIGHLFSRELIYVLCESVVRSTSKTEGLTEDEIIEDAQAMADEIEPKMAALRRPLEERVAADLARIWPAP